jgi:hypothetical protein
MADYYSLVARAVSRLPCNTGEARHAIYEQARTALREALSNNDPPFSEPELANEQAALDACIRVLEVVSDLRGIARDDAQNTRWLGVARDQILRAGLTLLNHQTRFAPTTTTKRIVRV